MNGEDGRAQLIDGTISTPQNRRAEFWQNGGSCQAGGLYPACWNTASENIMLTRVYSPYFLLGKQTMTSVACLVFQIWKIGVDPPERSAVQTGQAHGGSAARRRYSSVLRYPLSQPRCFGRGNKPSIFLLAGSAVKSLTQRVCV